MMEGKRSGAGVGVEVGRGGDGRRIVVTEDGDACRHLKSTFFTTCTIRYEGFKCLLWPHLASTAILPSMTGACLCGRTTVLFSPPPTASFLATSNISFHKDRRPPAVAELTMGIGRRGPLLLLLLLLSVATHCFSPSPERSSLITA